jgi:hypothetical protein
MCGGITAFFNMDFSLEHIVEAYESNDRFNFKVITKS